MREMEGAAGSADKEMSIIEESWQYKLNNLKQTWVGFFQDLVDRGVISDLIDKLTRLSEALIKVLEINPTNIIAGLTSLFAAIKLNKKDSEGNSIISLLKDGVGSLVQGAGQTTKAINEMCDSIEDVEDSSLLSQLHDGLDGITDSGEKATGVIGSLKGAFTKLWGVIAANPVASIAIGAIAVAGAVAVGIWNKVNVTVEEVQENIDALSSKIGGLKSQISQLENVDYRTTAQQERLNLLHEELDVQEELLEIEKRRKAEELSGNKFSDSFDKDNWNAFLREYQNTTFYTMNSESDQGRNYYSVNFEDYSNQYKETAEALQKLEKGTEEYNDALENQAYNESELTSVREGAFEQYAALKEKIVEMDEVISELNPATDSELIGNIQEIRRSYQKEVDSLKEVIDGTDKLLGSYDYTSTFNSIFQHTEFDGLKDELIKLGKEGKLSVSQLESEFPELIKKIKDAGTSTEELYSWLMNIADPLKREREVFSSQFAPKADQFSSIGMFQYKKYQELVEKLETLTDEQFQILLDADIDWSTFSIEDVLAKIQQLVDNEEPIKIYAAFEGTDLGRRIQHLNDLLNEEKISYREYFDGLQEELNSLDTSQFTSSMRDASNAAAQFFVDSTQTTAMQLDTLIHKFEEGEIGISEYLDSYIGIANTVSSLTDVLQTNASAWNAEGEAIDDATNEKLDQAQTNLQSAVEELESYQSAIYALTQIQPEMNLDTSSDEYNAYVDEVASAMQRIADEGGKDADLIRDRLGNTSAEIAESLKSNVANLSVAEQAMSNETNTHVTTMAEAIGTLFDELGQAISQFHVELTFTSDAKGLQDVAQRLLNGQAIHFTLDGSSSTLSAIGSAISSFGQQIAQNIEAQTTTHDDYHLGENENYKPKNVPDINQARKAGGGAGKEAGDAYVKAFEDELSKLDGAYERGEISLGQYLNEYKALIDRFFKGREEYAEEYAKRLHDYLTKMKDAFGGAISGVTTLLNSRISSLQKQKDKAIKQLEKEKEAALAGYQAQIDAIDKLIKQKNKQIKQLEKEKKAIDKKIKPLQDEIDAIQKANEERQRQIDLQKDLYELERAQNQRTQLVNFMPTFAVMR